MNDDDFWAPSDPAPLPAAPAHRAPAARGRRPPPAGETGLVLAPQMDLFAGPRAAAEDPALSLSDGQRCVLRFAGEEEGDGAVIARAGSGKTFILMRALAALPPGTRVLLCAYNRPIKEALEARAPRGADVETLHGLGYKALIRAWARQPVPHRRRMRELLGAVCPSVLSRDQRAVVGRLIQLCKAFLVEDDQAALDLIGRFRLFLPWEQINHQHKRAWGDRDLVRWARRALALSRTESEFITFDEMFYVAAAEGWPLGGYDFVLGDEFQDWTVAMGRMVGLALRPGGRVLAVGDDRQAINAFRGADSRSIERFVQARAARVMTLPITYRCARSIVARVRALVPDFEAAPGAPEGVVEDVPETHDWLASVRGDTLVVARTNAPLVEACLALLRRGTPAYIVGRDTAKDLRELVAAAERALDPAEQKPRPAPVREFQRWLLAYAAEEGVRLGEADEDDEADGLADRVETLLALCEGMATTADLRARIAALFDAGRGQRVRLATAHRAKGLEARHAIVLAWTFKLRSLEDENCLYVALSRAKEHLTVVGGAG